MTAEPARLPAAKRQEPTPPKHLRAEARRFWRSVVREYVLETHHLIVLTTAAEAFDRMRQAQAAIERDGAYISGRFGLKSRPALAIERDSRLAMLRAVRELGAGPDRPDHSPTTDPLERTMTRVRRRTVRIPRWPDEVRHLIDGDHVDCPHTHAELRALWDEHRNEVWDEFDRTTAPDRGKYVPWGAIRFDGVAGQAGPPFYPYDHLRGDAA